MVLQAVADLLVRERPDWDSYGFLRCGDFNCPSLKGYSISMLSLTDIYVDTAQYLAVHLHWRKTDQFGAGTTL